MRRQAWRTGTDLSRRDVLIVGAGALAASAVPSPFARHALADEIETHGLSVFGDLKYPADFRHFDYVDPNAPKGGSFRTSARRGPYNQSFLTFNSLNSYILKGDGAQGMELTFATLMARADRRAGCDVRARGALGARVGRPARSTASLLRPEAHFHDGTPLTAHDVAFSLTPSRRRAIRSSRRCCGISRARKRPTTLTVVVRFSDKRARDVPLFVAGLPIFSRAYYAKKRVRRDHARRPARFGPLQGRPLRDRALHRVRARQGLVGRRSSGLPRQFNFDVVRYEFYRDREVAFEGFTGKNYLFREEFTSRIWATRYDFPAIRDGRVKREVLPDQTPSGGQGWFINTRREQFKDRRVREALIYAFDFEWTNKNIMYGSYERTPFDVPELRHDGERQAGAGGARAAGAVPRQGAGRGVRRAVRAAGVRRLRAGPRAAAPGRPAAAGGRLDDQGRQARQLPRASASSSNS